MKGSNTWIILEGLDQVLKFELYPNNNHVEYKARITGKNIVLEMWASILISNNDSKLVANQVSKKYQENNLTL